MSQQESPLVIKAAGQEDGQDTARTPASSDALSQGMTGTVGAAASPAVMPALEAGTAYTPDQLVQARNASSILGRPEPLVRDSLQESMLEVQARRIAENKTFAGWVSQSAKNATIAKDDIEGLKPVFDSLDMIRQRRDIEEKARRHGGISAYEPGALETIKRLWNEGLFSVGEGMMGTSLLGADAVERNAKEWGLDDLAASAAAYGKSQRQRYQELLNKQPMPLQFDEGSLKEWGADFVRTVPQVGMQVSLAATTGPLSSMAFMGSQIAGNQYLDLVEHQKVDPSRAMWASLANAGMQMPLEYLGMDKLLAIGKVSGLGNVVRTAAVGALSEGATEWLQKYPEAATEILALAAKEGRGLGDNVQMFMDRFGKITREGMYEGSLALPFGLIGGGGRIAATYRAERYAAQQAGLQSQVEATKLRQMSPDMMQEMLEQNGVTGMEYIQGQTALELFQTDPAVYAEAFGLTQEQIMEAAAMGQDIEVSSARLMTKLDKERYAKVAEVMRETPGSMNLAEARSETKLSEDTMRVLERWQEQQQELSALAEERGRLREDAIRAVNEIPGLRTEAARMEGGVDAFVDTWLQPYERFAMRMASSGGRNMAETFRMLALNGLRQARRTAMTVPQTIGEDIADMQPEAAARRGGKVGLDESGKKRVKGAQTSLVGQKGGEKARYEVWEAAQLIPSHDPANGFARRADYPEGVQERPYHSDAGEQEKVLRNAVELDPRYLVNNNPDAINGPPIVTGNGVVLGGNSRAMSLQVAYQNYREQADAYRKAIAEQAGQYGIDPESLAAYDAPVLVRVVDGDLASQDMAVKSRQYNQSQTQGLQTKAEGVSKARLISPESVSALAEGMKDFDSLRAFLDSAASKKFVEALKRDGVIEQTQVARLTDKNGKLNDEGKTLVENALRGMIVPDYDVLAEAPPSVLNKLDRGIPALARLKARGEGWDMSGVVTAALRQINRAASQGQNVDVYLGQGDLLNLDADKNRPAVQALALTFDKATQKEVQARFELMARDAERQSKGQASLVAMPDNNPAASFVRSFMEPVALVDGENIADFNPRANEQHAALQYAYENGGKGHAVPVALEKLQKTLGNKKTTAEQKAEARERIRLLSPYSGSVAVYEPKLGSFFRYQQGQELFQPGREEIRLADESLARDAAAWAESVDALGKNSQNTRDNMTMLNQTPLVLQMLGANNLPVQMSPGKLARAMKEHDLSPELVKQVPAAMADPIMVFRSASHGGDVVMMLELKDQRGGTVVVPITLEKETPGGYAANIATSIYGKTNEKTLKPNDAWFARQIEDGNLLYRNNKKSRDWARTSRLQLPGANTRTNSAEQRIYTDADLVNLRQANPELYQQEADISLDAIVQDAKGQGIDLVVSDKNGIITVHKIVVPEDQRNQGAGTAVMQRLIDHAENSGKAIALTPSDDFDGSKSRLQSWYKQLGFSENKGRNKKFSTQETLVRLPQNPSQVFYQTPGGPRGSLEIRPEGYLINLFKGADLSTMLHETGHIFLEEIERAIQLGSADESLVRDYAALKNWLARFDTEAALKEEYNRSVKSTPAFQGRKFEELNDAEKAEARRIAEKEYFARGFEAYLMEGKAPAPELMGAFERFKAWLLNVYEAAKRNLGVELNDEVRGVFDRLLATEEEIEQVAASNELFALTQKELDALGVKGPERNYQASLMEAAKRRAVEKLQLTRDRDRRSRLAQWAKDARAEILQDPVYAARSELYTKDGFLDADAIAARYGEDALKSLRKSVGAFGVKPGGQDPELFAARHGFADGAQMLAAITEAESMGKRVREIVSAKEAAHDASIDPAPYLLETREAARQAELVGQYLARNIGKEALQQQAFERVAQEKLAAMPMGNARLTNQFTAAMRRALRQERIAIGKGDFEAALEANTQARLNLEFARQARTIAEMQEVTERAAKRFVKMAKADPSARYAVNDIAARYGLMQYDQRLIDGKDVTTIRNWLAARQEDGFSLYADDAILYGPGRPWREVTVREFENIAETVSQIVAVERNSRKLMTAANKESFEAAVDEAVQETFTYRQAKPIKTIEEESFITQGLAFVHAAHTKIEALCVALDGGKALGANWNLIYKPINDADNRRGLMFKELGERLKSTDLFGAYTAEELADMVRKKTFEPSVGESLTKGQRLMTALNMGNEGNYTRLLAGRNWTQEQAAAVVESLDARDWKFVQGIWDTFETYKEEAFSLQEEVSGQRPTSVEARPLKTQFGELRGGYFPVVYDRRHAKVDLQEKIISSDNPAFAMTRHGHLQERNSQGAGTPLDLSMSVIPAKLQDVITDLCYRRAYIDVGRVLRDKKYRHSIESTVGHEQYQAMVAWLKDAAKESKSKSDGENMAQWARSSATAMAMGYKFTTMLSQPFGITQSIEALGYTYTMQGINMAYGKGIRATMETIKWVQEASPMMAQRIKSFDRDVADATNDFARQSLTPDSLMSSLTSKVGLRKFEQWFKEHAFVPMGVVQYGVDLPTWCGAYQKGLKDFNGSETKARDYADSVVRLTQGSGATKDLARVQRGSQYAKLFTMFYSYFNTLYNMTAIRVADVNMNRDMNSVIRAGNSFLLLYMIPAILTEIAAGRGPDDDEEFLAWSAKQLLMYPMQTVVGMRSIAGAIEGEFSYKASPAEAAPEAIYKFIVEVNKALTDDNYKFDGKKFAKLSLKTLGYMGGLPLGQAEISAFNVWDYLDGTSGDYELRDLIFRRQKSRR